MTTFWTRTRSTVDQQSESVDTLRSAQLGRRALLRSGVKMGLAAGTLALLGKASAATPASAAAGTNTLFPGETLYPGQTLNGAGATLILQGDGNLVRYANGQAPWSSNTGGGNRLVMQGDGNLVLYDAGNGVVFATGTAGNYGARLVMQDDGNLVLYSADYSRALWYTNSPIERAIQWFYDHRGATNYEGRCESAVENAFGTSGRYATAIANWNARAKQYPYTAAPRGALVFYNTSAAGHVAVSLGNGTVISTSAGGRIGIVGIGYFQRPLGWAYAPW